MRSPIRIAKDRIGAAIAWRAELAAERRVQELSSTVHGLAIQVRDTAVGVAEWQTRVNETFAEVAMRLDAMDHTTKEHEQRFTSVGDLIDARATSTNNSLIEIQTSTGDALTGLQKALDYAVTSVRASLQTLESRVRAQPFTTELSDFEVEIEGLATIGFDGAGHQSLADFADLFRPDPNDLKQHLDSYSRWLPSSGVAIDLGAGRGEMVEVLSSRGFDAVGIDSDESMVERCKNQGLNAVKAEIGAHLASLPSDSVDVISAIHVVEHVGTPELSSWCKEIVRVLRPGGVFIAETPNPHAIDAFKAFWVDATHVRPYYPESLLHLAQTVGFAKALIWADGNSPLIQERLGLAGSYALIATK